MDQKAHKTSEVRDSAGWDGESGGEVSESDGLAVVVNGIGDAELNCTLDREGSHEAEHVVPDVRLSFKQLF